MANHSWTKSTLGHGETMCEHCKITNREAAVLGLLNDCDKAPAVTTEGNGMSGGTYKLKVRLLNHNGGIALVNYEVEARKVANAGVIDFCDKHYVFQHLDTDKLEATFKEVRTLKLDNPA